MSETLATTWPRLSIALFAGVVLCATLTIAEFAVRQWAAFGVFGLEDWLVLAPDVRGKMIDYLLGLGVGVGFWAIFHSQNQRSLPVALAVGAISMLLVPQLNAVLYVWRLFGSVDWSIALEALVRAAPMLAAGAFIAFAMWRVAYRKQAIVKGLGS